MTCAVPTCVCLWETKPAEENLLVNIGNRGLTCRGTPLSCANHRTQRRTESRTRRRSGEGARQPVGGRRSRRRPERARRRRRRHRATLTARPSPPPHAAQRPRKGRQKGKISRARELPPKKLKRSPFEGWWTPLLWSSECFDRPQTSQFEGKPADEFGARKKCEASIKKFITKAEARGSAPGRRRAVLWHGAPKVLKKRR